MTHRFDRFLQSRGYAPRKRVDIGGGKTLQVSVAPKYAVFSTYPYGATTYVPRDELITLIKWLVPLVREMNGSFSVEQAIADNTEIELVILQELREQKRHRYGRRPRSKRRRPHQP